MYQQDAMAYQQASPFGMFLQFIVAIYFLIVGWMIFEKSGQAGWKILIPFYNSYILVKITGMSGWYFLLFFLPIVNIIFWIIVALKLGKAFGKDGAWSFFLIALFPLTVIGLSILAFSKAKYKKP